MSSVDFSIVALAIGCASRFFAQNTFEILEQALCGATIPLYEQFKNILKKAVLVKVQIIRCWGT